MSKTLQQVMSDINKHINTHHRHLRAVAKKIDALRKEALRKKGASKGGKKRKR